MRVKIIAAIDNLRALGYNNDLLWKPGSQRGDMANFKKKTTGDAVVMGRKTWESIPDKYKPLKDRLNIVLSRTPVTEEQQEKYPDVKFVKRFTEAMAEADKLVFETLWVIGGGQLYKKGMKYCSELHLTVIHHSFKHSDTKFPPIEANQIDGMETRLVEMKLHRADEKNVYDWTQFIFECSMNPKKAPDSLNIYDSTILPVAGDVKFPAKLDNPAEDALAKIHELLQVYSHDEEYLSEAMIEDIEEILEKYYG